MHRLARLAFLGCILAAGCRIKAPLELPAVGKSAGPLDGAWIGRVERDEEVWTLLVEGERMYVTRSGSGDWLKGTFRLQARESLHELDLRVTECDCSFKDKSFTGLARLDGDHLEIAAGRPGEPRPETLDQPGLRRIRMRRATEQTSDGGTFTVMIGKP